LTFAIFYAEIKILKICSSELKKARLKKNMAKQFFQKGLRMKPDRVPLLQTALHCRNNGKLRICGISRNMATIVVSGLEIDFFVEFEEQIRAEFAMSCCIVTSPLSRRGTTVAYFQRRFSGKRIKDVRNFLKSIRNRLHNALAVAEEKFDAKQAQAQALLMS
jgi:hypothetical protein